MDGSGARSITIGTLLFRLGHDEIYGVLGEALRRQGPLVVDLLEVDGDAAQPIHQRILEQAAITRNPSFWHIRTCGT